MSDRRAVWLATALPLLLIPAALFSAGQAKATPESNYAAINAGPICSTLDDYPSVAGVTGVLSAVMEDSGFTAYQAGTVVGEAVARYCPRHLDVLQKFINVYAPGVAPAIGQLHRA